MFGQGKICLINSSLKPFNCPEGVRSCRQASPRPESADLPTCLHTNTFTRIFTTGILDEGSTFLKVSHGNFTDETKYNTKYPDKIQIRQNIIIELKWQNRNDNIQMWPNTKGQYNMQNKTWSSVPNSSFVLDYKFCLVLVEGNKVNLAKKCNKNSGFTL